MRDTAARLARRLPPPALFLTVAAGTTLAASVLDRRTYAAAKQITHALNDPGGRLAGFAVRWAAFLSAAGYIDVWLLGAAVLYLVGRERESKARAARRAAFLVAAVCLSGVAAEGLKLAIRRERPELHAGSYVFRPFAAEPWRSSDFGLPSSHAAVAMGAAFALSRLYPSARPIWLFLGVGCSLARVLAGAHFLSDIAFAGVLGYAVTWGLRRAFLRDSTASLAALAEPDDARPGGAALRTDSSPGS